MSKRLCIACKECINPNAIKCPHCGEYQNWTRHVVSSGLVLSLLIALLSISGIVFPIIKNTLSPAQAKLHLAIVKGSEKYIDFLISNLGSRSAVITDVTIRSKKGVSYYLYPNILHKVIEPNKTYSIHCDTLAHQVIPSTIPPILAAIEPKKFDICYLAINVIQYDGSPQITELPFKCVDIQNNIKPLTNDLNQTKKI